MIFPLKIGIFHCYVSLPEGTYLMRAFDDLQLVHLCLVACLILADFANAFHENHLQRNQWKSTYF